ncbi:MAG: TrkA family potassium uptake protein [Dermatophilaceae bacterium]
MPIRRPSPRAPQSILVVGLGRFGSALAETLVAMGREVLGVDENADLVQRWAPFLTHVVQADTTDEEALRQLGAAEFDRAIVAIGTDIEASVLTVLALHEIGVKEIWAKAISVKHGKILTGIGAAHVIYPEGEMGRRVAHMLASSLQDYIEWDGYALARVGAPQVTWGVPLGKSQLRAKHRITVVGVREPGGLYTYADMDTVIHRGDELLITGAVASIDAFSRLPTGDE